MKTLIEPTCPIKLPNPKKVRPCEFQAAKTLAERVRDNTTLSQEGYARAMEALIATAIKETKLLNRTGKEKDEILDALTHIARNRFNWERPLEAFKSPSHNPYRQLTALLDHLFAKYARPTFLDSAFLQNASTEIPVFLHIARGGNIRKLDRYSLTKTQAHLFHTTPNGYTIPQAILRAKAISHGIEEHLIPEVIAIDTKGHNSLLEKFLIFLGAQAMIDPSQIQPLWDYVLAHNNPPFSFKGRTVTSLINHMNLWHGELARAKASKNRSWAPSLIPNFIFPEKDPENGIFPEPDWQITEICHEKELHAEGKELHHCVYSYTDSCIKGNCTIWSLKKIDFGKPTRRCTIELRKKNISQVRGAYNAFPSNDEKRIIALWAQKAQLVHSKY